MSYKDRYKKWRLMATYGRVILIGGAVAVFFLMMGLAMVNEGNYISSQDPHTIQTSITLTPKIQLDITSTPIWKPSDGDHVVIAPHKAPQAIPETPTIMVAVPNSMVRTGAVCKDGSTSGATGRGACSHHGGVAHWIYQ